MEDKMEHQDKVEEPQKEPPKSVTDPSAGKEEVFNRGQVNELIQASQGTKDKEIAVLQKQVAEKAEVQSQLDAVNTRLKEMDDAKEKVELESAQDDPDLLAAVKRRQDARREIRDLEQKKREVSSDITQNEEKLNTVNELGKWDEAKKLAKEFGLSEETILKFGADTPEEMRTYAERYSKVLKGTGDKLPRPETIGGEPQSWRDLSPEDKIFKAVSQ